MAAEPGRQVAGAQPVQVEGQHGQGEIEVDLDHHGRGEPVEMEELELLGDRLLDQPAPRVAPHQVAQAGLEIVGQQHRGPLVGPFLQGDLAQLARAIAQADRGVVGGHLARVAGHRHANGAPRAHRQGGGRGDQVLAAPAQGHEADAGLVQLRQMRVGGEATVEDQIGERAAVPLGEVEELHHPAVGRGAAPAGRVARTLLKHRPLLLNWFRTGRVHSSGAVEGLNGKAKLALRLNFRSRGNKAP